jgi:hypothetical protein
MERLSCDQILLQVTLSADESPELFEALVRIRDPKRRVGRFRDLATRGLIFTLSGFTLAPRLQDAPETTVGSDPSAVLPHGVVDGLTAWTDS